MKMIIVQEEGEVDVNGSFSLNAKAPPGYFVIIRWIFSS